MTADRPGRCREARRGPGRRLAGAAGAAAISLGLIGCGNAHPGEPVLAAPAGSAHLLATSQGVIWSSRRVNGAEGLLRSTNRGGVWKIVQPGRSPGSSLVASFFFGGGTAWAVQRLPDAGGQGDGTIVLRTTNGGRTWARGAALPGEITGPGFAPSYQVYFADLLHGWVLAAGSAPGDPSASPLPDEKQRMQLWSTSNGGRTWHRLPGQGLPLQGLPLTFVGQGGCLDQPTITFVNPIDGWISQGSCGHGSDPPRVWRTGDGGRTWTASPLRTPAGGWGPWAGTLRSTPKGAVVATPGIDVGQVRPARSGIDAIVLVPVSVGRSGLVIERSTDGGRTWQIAGRVQLGGRHRDEAPGWWFDPIDAMHWVISAPGSLIETADGGQQWTYTGSAMNLPAAPISFINLSHGFMQGTGRYVAFHTADHGQTWTGQPVPQ